MSLHKSNETCEVAKMIVGLLEQIREDVQKLEQTSSQTSQTVVKLQDSVEQLVKRK